MGDRTWLSMPTSHRVWMEARGRSQTAEKDREHERERRWGHGGVFANHRYNVYVSCKPEKRNRHTLDTHCTIQEAGRKGIIQETANQPPETNRRARQIRGFHPADFKKLDLKAGVPGGVEFCPRFCEGLGLGGSHTAMTEYDFGSSQGEDANAPCAPYCCRSGPRRTTNRLHHCRDSETWPISDAC